MSIHRTVASVGVILSSAIWGCAQDYPEEYPEGRIEADMRFLTDDLLLGRATPSHGLDVAALYLANQLRAAGWEPGYDGSYLQPYQVSVFDPAEAEYTISINGITLRRSDYVLLSFGLTPDQTPAEFDLVFAGWGVSVPEEGVDDFDGLDVSGKAVVVLRGAPWELDPTVVHAPDHAIGKGVQAAVRGGAMLIYVSEEFSTPPPTTPSAEFGLLTAYAQSPLTQLTEDPRSSGFSVPFLGIGPQVFNEVLGGVVGESYEAIQARLTRGESVAQGVTASVRVEIDVDVTRRSASNVVAMLGGTDDALRDEWVMLTAHYDHVGSKEVSPGEDGIFNGANDNASGTAAVLEVARRLADNAPPKRSIIVVFTSGEEMGLLGSAHYTAHPLAPLDRTVVNLNADGVGRSDGRFQAIAPGSVALFTQAVTLGEASGLTVVPDQQPTWRLNYFLDSYHAARADIPALTLSALSWEDYHQPSDEVEKIRFDELGRLVQLMTALAEYYADGGERPAYQRPKWFLTPS